ncbi:MAG TPA: LiaF domain-containing protein [Nitriliruptoraceae bacterium]|nr:LiaF domain-containing protein [Nitriliruptoraceae bacterium]
MSTQAPRQPGVGSPPPPDPPPPPNRPNRAGVSIGAFTLGLVLVGIGVVALLIALDVAVPLQVVGPAILMVVGFGVLVSGIRGETDQGGLGFAIFVGVVLAVASFATAVWEVPLGGGVGDRTVAPTAVETVADDYRWGLGDLHVDLRDVQLEPGTTEVEVSVVMGQVEVVVPDGMAVEVDARVAAGAVEVLGQRVEGVDVDLVQRTDGFDDTEHRLSLVVRVGFGEADVVVR